MVQNNVIKFIHLCESEHCHDKFVIKLAKIYLKKQIVCVIRRKLYTNQSNLVYKRIYFANIHSQQRAVFLTALLVRVLAKKRLLAFKTTQTAP